MREFEGRRGRNACGHISSRHMMAHHSTKYVYLRGLQVSAQASAKPIGRKESYARETSVVGLPKRVQSLR
jgi:hypothetical protein